MEYASFFGVVNIVGLGIAAILSGVLIFAARTTRHLGLAVAALAQVAGFGIDCYQALIYFDLVEYRMEPAESVAAQGADAESPSMLADFPWFAVVEPFLGWLVSLGLCAFLVSLVLRSRTPGAHR